MRWRRGVMTRAPWDPAFGDGGGSSAAAGESRSSSTGSVFRKDSSTPKAISSDVEPMGSSGNRFERDSARYEWCRIAISGVGAARSSSLPLVRVELKIAPSWSVRPDCTGRRRTGRRDVVRWRRRLRRGRWWLRWPQDIRSQHPIARRRQATGWPRAKRWGYP